MDDYNVTYQRLTGGKYKDIGSSLRPLSDEERDMLQDLIDQMHGMFLESVAKNRGLEKDQIDEISTGMFFLGTKGKDLGLVDVLGGKTEAISIIEKEINQTAELVQYRKDVTFLDILSSLMAEYSYKLGMRSMISADNKISLR